MWTGGQGTFAQLGDEETQFLLRVTALSSNLFRTGAKVSLLNPTTVQCQEVNVVNVSLPRKILGCCRVIALLLRKVSINQTGIDSPRTTIALGSRFRSQMSQRGKTHLHLGDLIRLVVFIVSVTSKNK